MEFPPMLIDDLARRRAVVFIGAGVSRNCVGADKKTRPPLWHAFLLTCKARMKGKQSHVANLLDVGDYLTAADILKHSLRDQWAEIVKEAFVTPKFQPADIHAAVFRLDARVCLTQNIDKIYDTFAQAESKNTVVVKSYYDPDVAGVIRGDSRCVIKAHGTVDRISEMVFTRKEYAEARHKYHSFYLLVDALALTHTFLFVGCGTSDPDVQLMLERMAQLHPFARPHYMLARKDDYHPDAIESLGRTMNLRLLEYKATDDHRHLTTALIDLGKVVDARREELARSRDW